MCSSKLTILLTVLGVAVVGTSLGIFIWYMVELRYDYTVIELENEGFGDVPHHATITRITRTGDLFWWFYPTLADSPTTRPLLIWLDGVTGLPPSLLANFGMFGPHDFELNRRNDSWVDSYNLLFVDAPIGTGFSTARRDRFIPSDLEENTDHLIYALESFYMLHEEYENTPLYIFGQGHGAQMALALALELNASPINRKKGSGGSSSGSGGSWSGGSWTGGIWGRVMYRTRRRTKVRNSAVRTFTPNLRGVVLSNGIVAPSQTLTKLGFYLEEMGYVDANGRAAIEEFSDRSNTLVADGDLEEAYHHFLSLGDFINEEAGAVAVNLQHIVQKLDRETVTRDYFGKRQYLAEVLRTDVDLDEFMVSIGQELGFASIRSYDVSREAAVEAPQKTFMIPAVELVERVLQETTLSLAIVNGNLDALSTTPGQLDWVNNLNWYGKENFTESLRHTLVVNGLVEGYYREFQRLSFYWMNAAGEAVPLDSPAAMRRVLQRIVDGT